MNTGKDVERKFMHDFAKENADDTELFREQLRCLWTTFCLHYSLPVDTYSYDMELHELWSIVAAIVPDGSEWSSFGEFDSFMCQHLV